MDDFETFDPALFGLWTERPCYDEGVRLEDEALAEGVHAVMLETKSAESDDSGREELRRLLNDMTVEMREQFSTFRRLRSTAEALLEGGDEAAQKLARADVKAATDAMSLIVRTLEKVDALQRQLARDREMEAERTADEGGYEEAVREVERLIEERARDRFERWKREGRAEDCEPGGPRRDEPHPPDTG